MRFFHNRKEMIAFSKYHGSGNDFILIDDFDGSFPIENQMLISSLCHFHTGIGADGLILLQKPSLKDADFRMRIFNSDGLEAKMCGNGLSCITAFAFESKGRFFKQSLFDVQTQAGLMRVEYLKGKVKSQWKPPKILVEELEFDLDGRGVPYRGILIDSGERHIVILVDEDLKSLDVNKIGRAIRYHSKLSSLGANINFAHISEKNNSAQVRTYEKGVEQETLACGTGAMAVGYALFVKNKFNNPIEINFAIGSMQVAFNEGATIENTATYVFSGEVNLNSFVS